MSLWLHEALIKAGILHGQSRVLWPLIVRTQGGYIDLSMTHNCKQCFRETDCLQLSHEFSLEQVNQVTERKKSLLQWTRPTQFSFMNTNYYRGTVIRDVCSDKEVSVVYLDFSLQFASLTFTFSASAFRFRDFRHQKQHPYKFM